LQILGGYVLAREPVLNLHKYPSFRNKKLARVPHGKTPSDKTLHRRRSVEPVALCPPCLPHYRVDSKFPPRDGSGV
jgi:hypothetical protein